MTADLQHQAYVNKAVLYMALELSNAKCRLAFGDGTRQGHVVIAAGDVASLSGQIAQVKAKWGLSPERPVVSCYEGGRDGFWLHRQLVALGIANQVVDAASIEVSRRARRAKTDQLDAGTLLERLIRYAGGERGYGAWCGCRRRRGKICANCTGSVRTYSLNARAIATGSAASWWPGEFGFRSVRTFGRAWRRWRCSVGGR